MATATVDDLQRLQAILTAQGDDGDGTLARLQEFVDTTIRVRRAQQTKSQTAYHRDLRDAYLAAAERWRAERELATNGYRAEQVEFDRLHPRPTWKRFLLAHRSDRPRVCPTCGTPLGVVLPETG